MQFRVIKMKVAEDSYEYIITNLPHSFDLEDLKTCYHPCESMLYDSYNNTYNNFILSLFYF